MLLAPCLEIFRVCGSHLPGGCRTQTDSQGDVASFLEGDHSLSGGRSPKPGGREANLLRRACVRRASVLCAFGVGRIPKIDEELMHINDSNTGEDAERLRQNTRNSQLHAHEMEDIGSVGDRVVFIASPLWLRGERRSLCR